MSQQVTTTVRKYHSPLQRQSVWMGQQLASRLPVSHHWQPMGPRPPRGRGRQLHVIIMGSRPLTSPSPTCTACGSTSRGQVCHTEASWRCTPFTGHSQQPPAHWTVCSLADQTFVDVSLALVHAPGLSCRHVTRSAHRASGYQLAAICYSWCGDINKLTFLEKSQQQRLIIYQDNNQTTKTATCTTPFLTARHSVSFAQGSSHQPLRQSIGTFTFKYL